MQPSFIRNEGWRLRPVSLPFSRAGATDLPWHPGRQRRGLRSRRGGGGAELGDSVPGPLKAGALDRQAVLKGKARMATVGVPGAYRSSPAVAAASASLRLSRKPGTSSRPNSCSIMTKRMGDSVRRLSWHGA